MWASPVFRARGNRATASPDRERSSTKASPMAHRACRVGIRAVHRARWAANQAHSPMTAKAPHRGSFKISCFFSGGAWLARASQVSA